MDDIVSIKRAQSVVHYQDKDGGNTSSERSSGVLEYRIVGLMILQSLFSIVVDENRRLKSQITKLYSTSKEKVNYYHSFHEDSSHRSTTTNGELEDHNYKQSDDESLLTSNSRRMQFQLSKLQDMVSGIEGTDGNGLVKENYELKKACRHQQSVIEELEMECDLYRQLKVTDCCSESVAAVDDTVVKRVSEYEKMLAIEKTLVRELGIQLEQRNGELEDHRRQLDVERYGRQKAQLVLGDILNDLILCCIQMPYVAKDTDLKAAFENLIKQSATLTDEFRGEIVAAVEVVSDDSNRGHFLRNLGNDSDEDSVDDLSHSQAKAKVRELKDQLKQLRREAKNNVIEQMRKHKHATMRVKDTEEKLKKIDADKRLVEEQLGKALRRTRAELDEFVQSLGYRSSYATKAAESVRALIELLEDQKKELQMQRCELESESSSLRIELNEKKEEVARLREELSHVRANAMDEAIKMVQNDMEKLQSDLSRLETEKKNLKDRTVALEDEVKRERESKRLGEEETKRHQRQIGELQATNQSLVDSRRRLESKVADLEQQVQSLTANSQEETGRPSARSISGHSESQNTLGIRYVTNGLPRPEVVTRPLLSNHTEASMTVSLGTLETSQLPVVSAPSSMTSLSGHAQTLYSQSSRPGLFNTSEVTGGQGIGKPGGRMPFSSLQGVMVGSHSSSADSGLPSSIRERERNAFYSRSASSKSLLGAQRRDVMQCLRCGARFPVSNLDDYEKHIRECYSDVK